MLLHINSSAPSGGIDKPFRVRYFDNVVDASVYERLLATFPTSGLVPIGAAGHKVCFNSRNDDFPAFMANNPEWAAFHDEIKARFSKLCSEVLGVHHGKRVRFEFSQLPADDGGLYPHPDTAKKIATAVLYMEPDWKAEWGGGFEALRHKTTPDADFTDLRPDWSEVETILDVPLAPRRIVFMQRTNNSLHGVRPLRAERPRRSCTINLIG
jgi:hypothetical protein